MRIALRIFLSYLVFSLVLGGATLLAAYWSIEQLVTGVLYQATIQMTREVGLFFTASGTPELENMTPEQLAALQMQLTNYAARSERVETVTLIDNEGRIRMSSKPDSIGMTFKSEPERSRVLSDEPSVRDVPYGNGYLREITMPIESLGGHRIGTLRLQVIPVYFTEYLDAPRRRALWFFGAMVVFITASGVAMASLMTLPVRRLNRTLLDLQQSGATARVEIDERSDFAPALGVVRGLGERLEALAATTRSSELILSTITQALEQGVLIVDPAGRVVSINEAALSMLGFGEEEGGDARGKIAGLITGDPYLSHLVASPDDEGIRMLDLPRGVGPGRRHGLRVSSHVLRDGEKAAGSMLLLRDLDSIQALERNLQEASRLSLLTRLTSTVAHEIKNPLNSMVINVESLRSHLTSHGAGERREAAADAERTLDVILGEIYHLDAVIRDFLGLASAGGKEAAPTDVRDVTEKVIEMIHYEANQSRVRVEAVIETDLPPVQAVGVRLKQALLNLCLNAIQAMEDGGSLTVSARAVSGADEGVCIEVSDTGPGIPEGIKASIFDFQFTTKEGGSGLGLPITRMIVESAGGTIDFDSEPGQGTTFRLRFPAGEAARARGD